MDIYGDKMKYLIGIIVVVIGGLIYVDHRHDSSCELDAQTAAINTYSIGEYPDGDQRDQLRRNYMARYKEACVEGLFLNRN